LTDREIPRPVGAHENVSDWKPGQLWSPGELPPTGQAQVIGVLSKRRPRSARHQLGSPEKSYARSRVSFDIETAADMVKLTVTHYDLEAGSRPWTRAFARRLPLVLSSLRELPRYRKCDRHHGDEKPA